MSPLWLFNIVYTPGTVAYLLPFAHSLLRHSDARFRLIDNGCLPAERRLIEAFVRRHDRLEFWSAGSTACLPHSNVLDRLRLLPTDGPFCFLDSDIVASGPFLDPLRTALETAPAAFSGAPVWLSEGDGVFHPGMRSLTGEYLWDSQGRALGVTYVAAYDPAKLADVVERYAIGFAEYRWDGLSGEIRDMLDRRQRRADRYDTGKLLNSLLDEGSVFVPLPNLHHIGGFSFPALAGTGHADAAGRLPLPAFVRRFLSARSYRRFAGREEAALLSRRRMGLRDPVRRYFWGLLHAMTRGEPLPAPPRTGVADVDRRVGEAAEAISACYAEFRAAEPFFQPAASHG